MKEKKSTSRGRNELYLLMCARGFLLTKDYLSCIHPTYHALASASLMLVFTVPCFSLHPTANASSFDLALFLWWMLSLHPALSWPSPVQSRSRMIGDFFFFSLLYSLLFLPVPSLICLFVKNVWVNSTLLAPISLWRRTRSTLDDPSLLASFNDLLCSLTRMVGGRGLNWGEERKEGKERWESPVVGPNAWDEGDQCHTHRRKL